MVYNEGMKTINDIRRENTRQLLAECGSQKNMVEKTGRSQSQISQITSINGNKIIGDTVARSLELDFGKDIGWLDVDRSIKPVNSLQLTPEQLRAAIASADLSPDARMKLARWLLSD